MGTPILLSTQSRPLMFWEPIYEGMVTKSEIPDTTRLDHLGAARDNRMLTLAQLTG